MAQQLSATTADPARLIWQLCQSLEFFADHKPLLLKQLTQGNRTSSYQVQTDRGHYAVRHYGPAVLGVCRQQELRCQHAAAAAGLAPAPLCLNNHQRVLVTEFLADAAPPSVIYIRQHLPALAETLAVLHQLPVQTAMLDPWLYLQQLKKQLEPHWTAHAEKIWQPLITAARDLQYFQADPGLCHMDLHAQNLLLWQQKLWLIDFEYCQLADVVFDLVALIVQFELSEAEQQQLVASYRAARAASGAGCSTHLVEKLALAKVVYAGFCWLWYWQEELDNQDPRYKQAAAHCYQLLLRLIEGG
ncbi:aminoglycoside phosphotransferase family protein [Rheinheimera mesophila]|uniref:Aminoglycoside phosphotransferase family protein n=1 Tax=Rheinheimera mesophila TaxID=1547515 RepID=A0A3P3QS00_9GAMM|nr:aminoglycoside phosphotransferase family protein [Rheinheimera mesophila]RRJ23964.1 aminoglycoside phosphotransferase family protein [Rheinheimera mesophila]